MPMIKMLQTRDGSVDGHTLQPYQAGQVYDLRGFGGEDLARSFIQAGWAELVEEQAPGPQQNAAAAPPQAPAVAEKPHKPPAGGKR